MDSSVILISLSALGITLAGFAAIFRTFNSKIAADGHSHLRLIGIVESGIAISLLAHFPIIIQFFGINETTVFRYVGLLGGIYYLRLNFLLYMARNIEHRTPRIYVTTFFAAILAVILFFSSTMNIFNMAVGFYLLAVLMMFFSQGLAFVGQFWAENN